MKEEKLLKFTKKEIENLPDDPVILKNIIYYLIDEIQKLKDEINKLKGEKGKPIFKKPVKTEKTLGEGLKDTSNKKEHRKSSKKKKYIPIHNQKEIEIEEEVCPKCKCNLNKNGSKRIIIQDIKFELDNTEYTLENKCCSNKDCNYQISASLPEEIKGQEFGNNVRIFCSYFHYGYGLSQYQLHCLLSDLGMEISKGSINNFIQDTGEIFVKPSQEILSYHLNNTKVLNIDETGWKTKGENKYLYTFCNKFFSYFQIMKHRNAKTVNKVLFEGDYEEERDIDKVADLFITTDDHSSYSENKVKTLGRQLCWVHENRHYKKLIPFSEEERIEGERVLKGLWGLYNDIEDYRERNEVYNASEANIIENRFDELLSQEVKWGLLNHQMKLTKKKKGKLLLCLKFPFLESNNNRAERDLRPCVVIRNKNFGSRCEDGEKNFSASRSIISTLRKLNKNVYEGFKDLVINNFNLDDFIPKINTYQPLIE